MQGLREASRAREVVCGSCERRRGRLGWVLARAGAAASTLILSAIKGLGFHGGSGSATPKERPHRTSAGSGGGSERGGRVCRRAEAGGMQARASVEVRRAPRVRAASRTWWWCAVVVGRGGFAQTEGAAGASAGWGWSYTGGPLRSSHAKFNRASAAKLFTEEKKPCAPISQQPSAPRPRSNTAPRRALGGARGKWTAQRVWGEAPRARLEIATLRANSSGRHRAADSAVQGRDVGVAAVLVDEIKSLRARLGDHVGRTGIARSSSRRRRNTFTIGSLIAATRPHNYLPWVDLDHAAYTAMSAAKVPNIFCLRTSPAVARRGLSIQAPSRKAARHQQRLTVPWRPSARSY